MEWNICYSLAVISTRKCCALCGTELVQSWGARELRRSKALDCPVHSLKLFLHDFLRTVARVDVVGGLKEGRFSSVFNVGLFLMLLSGMKDCGAHFLSSLSILIDNF